MLFRSPQATLHRQKLELTRGLICGVPSGALGLTKGAGSGNFPATASASHSSMLLPDGGALTSCSLLTLTAAERSLRPARGTAEQLPKAAGPWQLAAWSIWTLAGEKETVEAMAYLQFDQN